jgi:uncharacterized membrane protein (DUF2068 family)
MKAGEEQRAPRLPAGARVIVGYKLVKGTLETVAAVVVALVAARALPPGVGRLALLLHEHVSAKWAHLVDALFSGGTGSRMRLAAAALLFDGAFTLVEAWSVWRQRPWAAWFVVAATGGFIPLEIMLLVEQANAVRVALLVVNVATVAYMIHRRVRSVRASLTAPEIRRRRRALWPVPVALLVAYAGLCYAVLPWLQHHRAIARAMAPTPDRALDAAGQPRDPLNVGFIGAREDVYDAMASAGWVAAAPLSRDSELGIAEAVLLRRSDPDAPVSNLFVDGHREDLAFEQQVGGSPRRRHHVRLWLHPSAIVDRRVLWSGAASYDRGVGFSRDTGQITHVIDPDIDAERDKLLADLVRSRWATSIHRVPGVGRMPRRGRTAVYTDGFMGVAVLGRPQR